MMEPTLRSPVREGEAGQTLILFALLLAVLSSLVALTVDVGIMLHQRQQLQNAADAAAMAGAQELPGSSAAAVAAAQQYAQANGVDLADPDYTFEATTPYQGDPGRIEVSVSSNVSFLFGRVMNLDVANVTARAVAGIETVTPVSISDASIIALSQSQCKSLEVNANSNFTAEGVVMINSECDLYAAEFGCNAICKALAGIESVGGVKIDGNCNPCNVTSIGRFADPLAGVPPPCFPNSPLPCLDVGPLTARHGTPGNPDTLQTGATFQPGIYYGGIDVGPSGPATFEPGIYIMAGGGFKVNSSASLTANGVFIYNTEDPDSPIGDGEFRSVIINSSAAANFSAMDTGPYAGLLFFQDRGNTEKAVFNPSAKFGSGTLYFPAAFLEANPNADMTIQIIADTIKINNNAAFRAEFEADKFFSGGGTAVIRLLE